MAPNATLHVFPSNDLIGSPIATITDEDEYFKGLKLKMERDGLGGAELLLSRSGLDALDDHAFDVEYFVRLIVHAYSDTLYYPWGFFFSKRQLTTIHKNEDGAEEFLLGGPGPKAYLERGILGIGTPSSGWNVDLTNGDWRFGDSATVGTIIGRAINQDANEEDPALPDLTRTFDSDVDSNGNPWSDTDLSGAANQYRIPIGTTIGQIIRDLDDVVELTSWIDLGTVASPKFELNVIEGLGDDNTGSAVGAGVCLLKEGLNIANDSLTVTGQSLRRASHVVVEGDNGKWAQAERTSFSSGDYVKRTKIEYLRSNSVKWLEKAGLRWLRRQDFGEKEYTVEIVPGASDATGYYFPAPDRVLWLSNLISLDTRVGGITQGHLDIAPSTDQLVTGIELELGEAGDTTDATASARSWNVTVHLNTERPGNVSGTPNQSSASNPGNGGGGGCKCIKLCHATTGSVEDTLEVFNDANDAPGSIQWTGLLPNQGGSGDGAEGSDYYYFKSNSPTEWSNPFPAVAGTDYRFTGYTALADGTKALKVGFFDNTQNPAGAGNNSAKISETQLDVGPTSAWHAYDVTLTAPAGTEYLCYGKDGSSISFDRLRLYTVGTPGSDLTAGTEGEAARCDHGHHVISESDPTADDDETLGLAVGTIWLKVDDAEAPTSLLASYILIDATEGAAVWEALGGGAVAAEDVSILDTAGDFTATNVEDALAELQSDAEDHLADTTDAHDASAISVADAGGYFTDADVEAVLQELGAATPGAGGSFFSLPEAQNVVGAFSTSSTSLSFTVTAPGTTESLVLVICSGNSRGPNAAPTQTNVTWTQRYQGNGNAQYVTIYTGVASASAGTGITVNFTGSGQQQGWYFKLAGAAQFTTFTAGNTATGTSAESRIEVGSLTLGGYYIGATSQNVSSSRTVLNMPWTNIAGFAGQGRCVVTRANAKNVSYDSTGSSASGHFSVWGRLT